MLRAFRTTSLRWAVRPQVSLERLWGEQCRAKPQFRPDNVALSKLLYQNYTDGAHGPEASTWAMMTLGFAGLGFAGFRRARAKSVFV
jgi:hypothetical protein